MKATAYVSHHDCSRHDSGWAHPEHQGRLPAVARTVYRDMLTLFDVLLEVEGRPASLEDLRLAHEPEYLERLRTAAEEAAHIDHPVPFEGGAMASAATWDAVTAAAGCVLTAVETVLAGEVRNAFCAVRPPGSTASAGRTHGYGLVNSVAVGARHLRDRLGVERVLVVEWGAAAGRGSAEILAADPGVRYAAVHREAEGGVPWPAAARTAALPAGSDGARFAAAAAEVLRAATADFTPDFVLLSAGFDALASDPLGGLALEPLDYRALTLDLVEYAAAACGGRLVSVLEGGYDPPGMARAALQHIRALAGLPAA